MVMGKLTDSLKAMTGQAEYIKASVRELNESIAELGRRQRSEQEILARMDELSEDAKSTVELLEQDLKETIALLQEN